MWTYGSLYVSRYRTNYLWCLLANHQQVNWPKLNTPQWAIEAYEDTLNRVRKDPVVGRFVGGGKGDARLGTLEEGKKRRE